MAATSSPTLPTATVTTNAGVTHIDLAFAAAVAKGRGSIFVTDGAIQTVIDRVTGEPTLRVVGATVKKEIGLGQVSIDGRHASFDAADLAPGKHYSIFMAPGVLSSGGIPIGGITVPNQLGFDVAALPPEPPEPPALSASFSFDGTTLRAGQDIEILVTLSRAVTNLPPDAFSAEHASILQVIRIENSLTWKVILTGSGKVADPDNVLTLDLSQVEIAPGLHGSGVATSPAYAVDTLVGAWVAQAGSDRDTGISQNDNLVNSTAPYIRGELHGDLADGETIELVINNAAVDSARINVSRDGASWFWSYAPAATGEEHILIEGANTIEVRVKNAAGHSSAAHTTVITVDTAAPEIAASPDGATGLPLDAAIVITFKEPVYWRGGEGNTLPVTVHTAGDDSIRVVEVDASAFLRGASTLTLDPEALGLAPGKHYEIGLPADLTDYAGNSLLDAIIAFQTAGPHGGADQTGPVVTHAIVDGDLFYQAGETITFRLRFNEAVRQAANTEVWVGLSNGGSAYLQSIDGDEAVFSYTVDEVDADIGNLTITDATLLIMHIEDLSGNPLTSADVLLDGFRQNQGSGDGYLPVTVVVDTVAPDAPGATALDAASDSGILEDSITNVRTPTLTGHAEADAWISILKGDMTVGGTRADASGDWAAMVELPPGDGQHSLTVVQTDRAGNQSAGAGFTLTIDTAAAALGAPALANDTGVQADRITSDATLKGSGAEANADIQIVRNGAVVGFGSADAAGNWTADFNVNPGAGAHTVAVRQIDQAGNTGALSPTLTFTMQPPEPVVAAAPRLAAASDTGRYDNDGITKNVTPTFSGSGAAPHSTIALFAGSREIGRAPTDAQGNWSVNVGPAHQFKADGSYDITSRPVGAGGVLGAASQAMALVIDTTAPRLTAFHRPSKAFELQFGEQVFFEADGEFRLVKNGQEREVFKGDDPSNWSITDQGDTHLLTLRFNMNGSLHLSMQNANGVQDIAGNAAVIVGTPAWLIDIFV